MQATDFQQFKKIMAGLGRVFGADTDGVLLDAYWIALNDWPLADFEKAAGHLLANNQFMPKPADFTALRKAGQQTTGEAFAKARAAMRAAMHGELPSLSCGDPAIDSAIRACGGYEAFAMVETDKIGFFERRFAEHYAAVSDSTAVRDALPFVEQQRLQGPRKLLGAA